VEFADLAGHGGTPALVDSAFHEADALVHVVRAFRDPNVPHVHESIDPARDARAMEDELILADLAAVERRLERIEREARKGAGKELADEQRALTACRTALESGTPLRAAELDEADRKRLRGFQLLSAKPLLVVVNLDEADIRRIDQAAELAGLQEFVRRAATRAVGMCAKIELEIAELDPADRAAFLADLDLAEPALNRIIRATYALLGYISFFTVGKEEVRAWSIPRGTPAEVAAGEIHTDMARGFIRAEVAHHEDLLRRGSLAACRDHGELRLEGKDYIVKDGDVVYVRFAT
jgi:GTP-binding protein YchF